MRTSISKQLGLPVAPPLPKAPSLEVQLGFVAEYDKSLNTNNNDVLHFLKTIFLFCISSIRTKKILFNKISFCAEKNSPQESSLAL